MFPAYVENEIRGVAVSAGLEGAALLAAAEVAGGGQALAEVNGRLMPLIDWRFHVFHRRVRPEARGQAQRAGLGAPRAEAPEPPRTQKARWALFARARLIDREAAHAAVCWGLGRVPGECARTLGYESAEALADDTIAGPAGQARAMVRLIDCRGLRHALCRRDWAGFAAGYGAPFCDGAAERLERAFARWRSGRPAGAGLRPLAIGDRGAAVRILQGALAAAGVETRADGVFGPETRAALRRFQAAHGLVIDGIAGARTLSALAALAAGRGAAHDAA